MSDLSYVEALELCHQFLREFVTESVIEAIRPDLQEVCGGYLTRLESSELRCLRGIRQTDKLVDYTKKSPKAFRHFIEVLKKHNYSLVAERLIRDQRQAEAECPRSSDSSSGWLHVRVHALWASCGVSPCL